MPRPTQIAVAVNKWFLTVFTGAITIIGIPMIVWANNAVHDNIQVHEYLKNVILREDCALKSDFDAKLAAQPAVEWKSRIISLEAQAQAKAEQLARLEVMLTDVRTRMIRWDEERMKTTNRTPQ